MFRQVEYKSGKEILKMPIFHIYLGCYPHLASPQDNLRRCYTLKCFAQLVSILWRDKLHETFHSITYPATAKIVARHVARAVAEMFCATCPATMSPKHCETSCTKHFMVYQRLKDAFHLTELTGRTEGLSLQHTSRMAYTPPEEC